MNFSPNTWLKTYPLPLSSFLLSFQPHFHALFSLFRGKSACKLTCRLRVPCLFAFLVCVYVSMCLLMGSCMQFMTFNVSMLYAAYLGRRGRIQQGETAQRGLRRGIKGVWLWLFHLQWCRHHPYGRPQHLQVLQPATPSLCVHGQIWF